MMLLKSAGLYLVLLGVPLLAQQVRSIDLTGVTQRTELRYPPAAPVRNGIGGGSGGSSVGDCGVDSHDPRSLTAYVQSVTPRDGDANRRFGVEFKVLNTGKVPLELPVSPDLSDLQPNDASAPFQYISLALAVSPTEDRSSIGFVELYGTHDAPETMVTLKPGEWLRVAARIKFNLKPPPAGVIHLAPGYWVHRVTYLPHPGGSSSAIEGICLNQESAPSVPVHVSEARYRHPTL